MPLICHISDWHATADSFRRVFDEVVIRGSQQYEDEPDMCVLTGDMVRNWHPSLRDFGNEAAQQQDHFEEMVAYVAKCWPGTDIFGVRGNHDWFDYTVGACKGFDQPGRTTMAMGVVESYMWNGMVVSGFRGVTVHTGFWQVEFPDRYFV